MRWLVRTDLRYQWAARHVLAMGITASLTVLVGTLGLILRANHELAMLTRHLAGRKNPGAALERALAEPLNVMERPDGAVVYDNAIRYWYESAQAALLALDPIGFAVNAAQVATVLLPPAFALMAVVLVTRDGRFGTMRIRAVRFSLAQLHLGDLIGALVLTLMTVVFLVGLAAALGPLARQWLVDADDSALFGPGPGTSVWELAGATGLLAAVAVFSVVVGLGLGLLVRRVLLSGVVLFVLYFGVPRMFAWDPRNLWLMFAEDVLSYEGALVLAPVVPGATDVVAAAVLVAIPVALVLSGHAWSRRRSRYPRTS